MMGINDDLCVQLEVVVCVFIVKVMSFSSVGIVDFVYELIFDDVEVYVVKVLEMYDNVVDDDGCLNVIMGEFCLVLYGMGLDVFNVYCCIGKFEGMELMFQVNFGLFLCIFWYLVDYVNCNLSVFQCVDLI